MPSLSATHTKGSYSAAVKRLPATSTDAFGGVLVERVLGIRSGLRVVSRFALDSSANVRTKLGLPTRAAAVAAAARRGLL
jgi:hypothetical protein